MVTAKNALVNRIKGFERGRFQLAFRGERVGVEMRKRNNFDPDCDVYGR